MIYPLNLNSYGWSDYSNVFSKYFNSPSNEDFIFQLFYALYFNDSTGTVPNSIVFWMNGCSVKCFLKVLPYLKSLLAP